jgi:hypothetical protein
VKFQLILVTFEVQITPRGSPALAMPLPLRMLTRNGAAASALTEKKTKNLGKQVIENQAYHTY